MRGRRMGVYIGRRQGVLACLDASGSKYELRWSTCLARAANERVEDILAALLNAETRRMADECHGAAVFIALSPADLACAAVRDLPLKSAKQVQLAAGAVVEELCGTAALEELAFDLNIRAQTEQGTRVEVGAIEKERLARLCNVVRDLAPGLKLTAVAPMPCPPRRNACQV